MQRALQPSAHAAVTDLQEVRGQEHVKRALEVAAAGGHNVLLAGPPGAGKTLLSRALPGILPTMTLDESLEVTRIYSVADMLPPGTPLIRQRPFRAPHHTISHAGLVGGGRVPRPGEISLAHTCTCAKRQRRCKCQGVLFLDELPEFDQRSLEVLRQPLEDKIVTISRAAGTLTFPASFQLVAAMNPCPCGFYGDPTPFGECTCSPSMVTRYQKRISGPLLDPLRVDTLRVSRCRVCPTKSSRASDWGSHRLSSPHEWKPHGSGSANASPRTIRTWCATPI